MTNEKSRFLAIYGATLLALIVVIVVILSLESATSRAVVDENGLVETASVAVYFFCFLLILFFVKDVRLQTRAVLAFILLCLIAREIGLPALLGMAPVQFAMFRNPGVSLVEKISVVLIFAALAYSIGYFVFTYAIYVVRGSFRLEPVPVGIILGLGLLSVAQVLDRVNLRFDDAAIAVADIEMYAHVAEEVFELGGPIKFMIAIFAWNRIGPWSPKSS